MVTKSELCMALSTVRQIYKGSFNNYVDRILPFFDPSPAPRGQFLYPERGQNRNFSEPPNSVGALAAPAPPLATPLLSNSS